MHSTGISPSQPRAASRPGWRRCRVGFRAVCSGGGGLGTGRAGVEHLRLFTARHSSLPWQRSNLQEGEGTPSPTSCRITNTTTCNREALAKLDRFKSPLQGTCQQEKDREMPEGPVLNLSQGDKTPYLTCIMRTHVFGPNFQENNLFI